MRPSGRRVSLRETIAASSRTAWEPIELVRTRPVPRPRPVTMVVDVSELMRPYATAYLHLMHALAGSNVLVHVPEGVAVLEAGAEVEVWML